MAEKKKSDPKPRALLGNRSLQKSFNGATLTVDVLTGQLVFPFTNKKGSWQFIDPANTLQGIYVEDYFDTSGYTLDYLTTMPLQAQFQEAGRWQMQDVTGGRILCLDLLMTDRIEGIVPLVADWLGSNTGWPGFPYSNNEPEQIIYGRLREYIGVTQGTAVSDVLVPVSDMQFGSLGDTTADKIWIYRFYIITGIPGDSAFIRLPGFRPLLDIQVEKESEDAFLMRQKRSYELANY